MELNQLCVVLQAATSPDVALRTNAEATLKQYQHVPGHMTSLLRVAVEDSLDPAIRQVASITFKNLVKKDWSPAGDGPSPLPDQDKAQVKDNLLEGIIRTPPLIRSQLGECAKAIAYSDFPEQWPGLLPALCGSLGSPEQPRLWGALFVLRILARKYEFKDEEDRVALIPVINTTFPALLVIFKGLIALDSSADEVAELMKLCLKIFWSATYMEVPALLLQPEPFAGWMTALHTLVVRPVPTVGQPEDIAERAMWVWWKTKKWVIHITQRLVSRYGDARHCREGVDQAFSQAWIRDCSANFLEAHLAIISQVAEGQYLSPRVTNLVLNYLQHAMKTAAMWKLLKPHVPALLQRVLFPLMCFADEDQELWTDDPHEYVRKGYDIIEEMYSPKSAAANFVHELCSTRPKGNLEALMHQVVMVFSEYQAAVSVAGSQNVPMECARRLDGALLAVGSLSEILKAKAPYKNQLEPMLVQYVQPLFASPVGHLRAKAAWVSGTFADIKFSAGRGIGPHFNALFQANVHALRDPDLPVRVDAVVALRGFVDAFSEEEVAAIKPLIPALLDEFFKLMNEVDNDDLVGTLETIVEKFGEEMAPYAVGLCQHLTAAFWRILSADDKENEDEGEEYGPLAAFGCLRALSTVLDTVSSLPHLIPQLEVIIFPVLQRLVSSEGQDVLEEVMELLAYFTYYTPTLSPAMWSLWPQLHEVVLEFGIEYFDSALMPFDNFISRGTDHFLSCKSPDYLASVNEMVTKTLTDTDYDETDVQAAPKLMEVVLQNCKGRVDQCVGPYLSLALRRLPMAETAYMKDLCMNVVAGAFIYNAELAVGQLQALGASPGVFSTWCGMIATKKRNGDLKHFRRMYDKKVQALGLLAILAMREGVLPPEVAGALDRLLAGAMVLLSTLKDQQDLVEDGSDSEDESDEEEDDSPAASPAGRGDEEVADDEDDADDGYLSRLSRSRNAEGARHHEESDDEDEEWTEEEDASTPLDPIDPFITFADTLEALRLQNPGRLQAVTAGQNPEMKALLQDLLSHAQQQKIAAMQQAAQT